MKKLKEHNGYPYDVVTKYDQYIKGILSNPEKSRYLISEMSDKDIVNLLAFADKKYKDALIKFIFYTKKESISDYLIVYLLENSYDMDEMAKYFSQFIPKDKINDIVAKSRLKVSRLEESIRKIVREFLIKENYL